ncbi:MAG: sugar phosphate nucleotidyltransferase [Saprospiraceae bacterium]
MSKKSPTLLLLAAGMGSRYGGLKQLDSIGPSGETILDYSVYDAIQAGFGKVVFVIRDHFEEAFEEKIAAKFREHIEVEYAYQPVNLPNYDGVERTKPWGTGHAVLVAKDKTDGPFAVANADDFYGRSSFGVLANFLKTDVASDHFAMVGFDLGKTLSPNGSVSRGVCEVDENDFLKTVRERTNIIQTEEGIRFVENEVQHPLESNVPVSMNLWGFDNSFFETLEEHFSTFVEKNKDNSKSEYYIPLVVNELLEKNEIKLRVLPTTSQWFGVTYQEDKPSVENKIDGLIGKGDYGSPLF